MALPIIGTLIGKLLDKGGDVIKEVVKDKDLAAKLDHDFRMAVQKDEATFSQLEAQIEADIYKAHQETIQAELHQSDLYTKRSRPKIARLSFYAGLIYALLTALPEKGISLYWIVLDPWQFEWSVLMLLYSPALTYMGVRSFDKWKK